MKRVVQVEIAARRGGQAGRGSHQDRERMSEGEGEIEKLMGRSPNVGEGDWVEWKWQRVVVAGGAGGAGRKKEEEEEAEGRMVEEEEW